MPDSPSRWKSTPVIVGLLISLFGGIYYADGWLAARDLEIRADEQEKAEDRMQTAQIEWLAGRTDRRVTRLEDDYISLEDEFHVHAEHFDERLDDLQVRIERLEAPGSDDDP